MTRLAAAVARLCAAGAVAAVCVTCSTSPAAPDAVAIGSWGGDHVAMEVNVSGATLEFDCAHARIDEAIVVDGSGRFDVRGTYTQEHGGPIRENEEDRRVPARFTGRVSNKSMTLVIATTSDGQSIGTFALEQGKTGRVFKCL